MEGSDVTKVQGAWKKLGYMSKVTGYYGQLTEDAVKAFRSATSLRRTARWARSQ